MSIDPAAGTMGILGFAGSMLDPDKQKLPTTVGTGNPLADPLLNYASQFALMQMGQAPDPSMQMQGSPFSVALSRYMNQAPLTEIDISFILKEVSQEFQSAVGDESFELSNRAINNLTRIASAIGMSVDELVSSQRDYTVKANEQFERASQVAELQRQGQFGVTENLTNLMMNLPDVSREGIEQYKGMEKERILRDLNLYADEASLGAMQQANFANYNPGRVLGDIEEQRLRGTQDADLA